MLCGIKIESNLQSKNNNKLSVEYGWFKEQLKYHGIPCIEVLKLVGIKNYRLIAVKQTHNKRNTTGAEVEVNVAMFQELGINPEIISQRRLTQYPDAKELVVAEVSNRGREHLLISTAAHAWKQIQSSALNAGVEIYIVSAFRSASRQVEIIQGKLEAGECIEAILEVLAPPGYSEHHSGCAIDISTSGVKAVQTEFEGTAAYAWLCENAGLFGFSLSYPIGNAAGYRYEPWHWCYHSTK